MTTAKIGRTVLCLGGCLGGTAVACGDLGDAQLPLPVYGRTTREPVPEPSDDGALRVVPQTVVRLAVGDTPERPCPVLVEAELPDESATMTLVDGDGPRAISGESVLIACRVAARPGGDGGFELDLQMAHARFPRLDARGELGPASTGTLALELVPRTGPRFAATCPIDAREVLDGAVWFRTVDCRVPARRTGACAVEIEAIFENCRP